MEDNGIATLAAVKTACWSAGIVLAARVFRHNNECIEDASGEMLARHERDELTGRNVAVAAREL